MPIDRAIQKILDSAAGNEDGIVGDYWYFNTDHIKLVQLKGDEMSKRTEISYRNIKNVNPRGEAAVEFVGYKNVMTLDQIDMEIGEEVRAKQYAAGRCYYEVPAYIKGSNKNKVFGIRICNRKESILGRDYIVGMKYSPSDWHFFIDFLLESGERYGEIKADLKAAEVQKILI